MKLLDHRSPGAVVLTAVVVVLLLWPLVGSLGRPFPLTEARQGTLVLPGPGVTEVGGAWRLTAEGTEGVVKVPSPLSVPQAVYRLQILGLEPGGHYGLLFTEVASAFRVSVNGVFEGGRGDLAPHYRPEVGPTTVLFTAQGPSAQVEVEVENLTSRQTGLWQSVYLGKAQAVLDLASSQRSKDVFMVAVLWFLALFFGVLALLMPHERAPGLLALSTVLILTKTLFSGTMLGFSLVPTLPYEGGMALAYLVITGLVPLLLFLGRVLYPTLVPQSLTLTATALALVETVAILGYPFRIYQESFVGYQLLVVAEAVFLLVTGFRAVAARLDGGLEFLAGLVFLSAAVVNDILFDLHVVNTGFVLDLGFAAFLMAQTVHWGLRFGRAQEEALRGRLFERWAHEDALTGLLNRRGLDEALDLELSARIRYQTPLSVLMVDIDKFKSFNDDHGHLVGDALLVHVASVLRSRLRKTDQAGRFGGEEFLVILRHTTLDEAVAMAEGLRAAIEATPWAVGEERLGVTVSIGVAEATDELLSARALVGAADTALYRAKEDGRNRVSAVS